MRRFVFALALVAIAGCNPPEATPYEWHLPPGFPEPNVPEDNPMSEAKVELGRYLFYDTRLSGNQTYSCSSCHHQDLAFTDGLPLSIGSTGEHTPRGAMNLTNVAYVSKLTWANDTLDTPEQQALVPMFGETPPELGLSGMEDELVGRLEADMAYPTMFADAFPNEADPINVENIVKAIGAFERTMISGNSPYDRYTYQGDDSALSESALRGLVLFNGERFDCFHCHGGFDFSDAVDHQGQVAPEVSFHNTGLYNIDGRGGYPAPNRGIYELTGDRADMGKFRAPTLRNVAVTAPFMHDGSIATLEEVLDHYQAGGRTITDGPYAGVGSESPLKSIFVHGFDATDQERADVLELIRSLTDDEFLHDPRFSDPFAP